MSAHRSAHLPATAGDSDHAALFAAIFEHSLDVILLLDDNQRFITANPAACQLLGHNRDDWCGLTIADITPAEDRPQIPEAWAAFRTLGRFRKNWRFQSSTGTIYIMDMCCTANILHGIHLSVARDVTAQKKAEAEATLLRRALDALDHGIMITDHTATDHPTVYANPAVSRVSGYSLDELIGRNPRVMRGPHADQPGLAEVRATLRNGSSCLVELINQRKNGDDWINLLSLTPIRDSHGRVTHYVGVQTDVTRLRDYLKNLHPSRLPAVPTASNDRRTVLLVEDEEAIREFVRVVLEQAGYQVIPAIDGEHALNLFRSQPNDIDLVLTDVVMPRRTGPELAAELKRMKPQVRVLFMSGYPGGTASNPVQMPREAKLLEKPFSLDRLLRAVSEALTK